MEKALKNNNHKRLIIVSRLLFLAYLIFTLYFLLFAESFGRAQIRKDYSYNLVFLKEIKRYLRWAEYSDTGFKMMILNIWGNIICFIPFGFFLPLTLKKIRNGMVVTIITFAFSLIIETFQLVLKVGSFDVDDLFLNTVGGIAGYIVYIITRKIFLEKRKKHECKKIYKK